MHNKLISRFKSLFLFSTISLSVLVPNEALSQDISYSQFFNNKMYYNPAYAGDSKGMQAGMNYRNQWNKLASDFNNYMFSLDFSEPNLPGAGGLGIMFQSDFDGIGNIKTTSATLVTSVKIQTSKNFLMRFGLNVGFARKSMNWDNLLFSDQIDPRYGRVNPSSFQQPDYNTITYPDVGAGLLFKYSKETSYTNHLLGTLALSFQHLSTPNISFYHAEAKLPVKFVVMGDVLIHNQSGNISKYGRPDSRLKINPAFMYEQQGKNSNFSIGVNAYKSFLYAGMWLRSQTYTIENIKDLVLMVGTSIPIGNDARIKLRYSYDYILTDMRRYAGATHEISIIYELDGLHLFGVARKSDPWKMIWRSRRFTTE